METPTVQENLQSIPIDQIIIDPETQVRLDLFVGIDELAGNIKEVGLQDNFKFWIDPEGHYHLSAGRRRLEALKLLGMTDIPPGKYDVVAHSFKDSIITTITENIQREDLNLVEEAKLLQVAINAGWTEEELAEKEGKKPEWVKGRLAVLKLGAKGWEAVAAGKIGIKTVKRLADVPKSVQASAVQRIVDDRADERESQEIINRETEEFDTREKFHGLLKDSKFPKCPECNADPIDEPSHHGPEWAMCKKNQHDSKHTWSLKTGQTLDQKYAVRATSSSSRSKKGERPLVRAFRYNIPVPIIRDAIIAKAIALAQKELKKKDVKTLSVTVDNWDISVDMNEGTLSFHLPNANAWFEPKRYNDKNGNLTKVIVHGIEAQSQSGIDRANAVFRKFLESLPEIADFRRKHKLQRML